MQGPLPLVAALRLAQRRNQWQRALHYADVVGAEFVVPSAGPPCFLDPELFGLNDLGDDPSNTFPDAFEFLPQLGDRGRLMMPGSVGALTPDGFDVEHVIDPETVQGQTKATYLKEYAGRQTQEVALHRPDLTGGSDERLHETLIDWLDPLVKAAEIIGDGIGGIVVIEWGDDAVALDFVERKARVWRGEPYVHRFTFDRPMIEMLVLNRVENWPDEVFLGCRFTADRVGKYNDFVYSFLRCLSPERLAYAESFYAEQAGAVEMIEMDGHVVQRFCPHLRADLKKFGKIEDGVLTCSIHGWRFDVETGRCLTGGPRLKTDRALSERLEN